MNHASKEPLMLYRTTMSSPIGELTVLATDQGVFAIRWDSSDPAAHNPVDRTLAQAELEIRDVASAAHPVLAMTVKQLTEYFDGERTSFDVPLDAAGTEFQRAAWATLCEIPFGETVTYGWQATRMGDRNKARAVGAANGKNPIPIIVPCHRVVGANGHLTGFAGGLGVKAWLLDHERSVLHRVG